MHDYLVPLYLASPLGFSEAGSDFKDTRILPMLKINGFRTLDPWTLTDHLLIKSVKEMNEGAERRARWSEVNKVIAANNITAIRQCRIMVAVLDGTDVDSGTAFEMGFASALGIPIIGYRGDWRLSADNEGAKVNLQVEFGIDQSGGEIVTKLQDLEPVLMRWHAKLTS